MKPGLPFIVDDTLEFEADLVRKYEIGIVINHDADISNLRKIIESCNYEGMKENVLEVRENEMSMSKNIHRWISFHETL